MMHKSSLLVMLILLTSIFFSCDNKLVVHSDEKSKFAESSEFLDSISFSVDTLCYVILDDSSNQIVLNSAKYGAIKFGRKFSKGTPEKTRYHLHSSHDEYFMISRSCGSQCWVYVLINVKTGDELFETENLIYGDLKNRLIIVQEDADLVLFRLEEAGVALVERKSVKGNVPCVDFNSCIIERIIDNRSITLKLEVIDTTGDSYFENVEFLLYNE